MGGATRQPASDWSTPVWVKHAVRLCFLQDVSRRMLRSEGANSASGASVPLKYRDGSNEQINFVWRDKFIHLCQMQRRTRCLVSNLANVEQTEANVDSC